MGVMFRCTLCKFNLTRTANIIGVFFIESRDEHFSSMCRKYRYTDVAFNDIHFRFCTYR